MQPFRLTREILLEDSSDTSDSQLQECQLCREENDHHKYGSDGESVADDDEFLDDNDYDWFKKAAEEDEKLVSNPKLLDYICNNDKKEKKVKETNGSDQEGNPSFLNWILDDISEERSTISLNTDTSDDVSDDSVTSESS